MAIPFSYNLRSLFVRKTTTIATALGIALVVFVLAASLMLARGIKETLISSGGPNNALILRKGSDSELASGIENKQLAMALSAPGVKKGDDGQPLGTGEVVVVVAMDKLDAEAGQISNVLVRGVQDNVYAIRPQTRIIQGRPAKPGTDEAVVGKAMLGRFKGLQVGSSFELKKGRNVQVVGVFESGGSSFESEVWVDLETLRTTFGREGLFSSMTVILESPTKYDAFEAYIEGDKQLGLESFRERAYYDKQSEGTSMVVSTLGVLTAFFFSVGAMIGAMITMYGSVAQRTREIGTLRALGFSRLAILVAFLSESAALAVMGAIIGAALSLITTFFSLSTMNYDTWQEISFRFQASPDVFVISIVAGGVMGIIGGFMPALRAARTSPIAAMRA
jgi:putative ABC transport system permease protein